MLPASRGVQWINARVCSLALELFNVKQIFFYLKFKYYHSHWTNPLWARCYLSPNVSSLHKGAQIYCLANIHNYRGIVTWTFLLILHGPVHCIGSLVWLHSHLMLSGHLMAWMVKLLMIRFALSVWWTDNVNWVTVSLAIRCKFWNLWTYARCNTCIIFRLYLPAW
jgi:hypothetical protein